MNFVSKWFDKTQLVFIQFTETLSFLEDLAEKYALLLPPNPERVLTVNYNLPPSYTFFILRGSFKPIYELKEDEFNDKVHLCKSILDMHLQQRIQAVTDEKDEQNEYFDERSYLATLKNEDLWSSLNPKLYTIFWYLNLQNLLVPETIYHDQIKKIQKEIDEGGTASQKGQSDKLKKQKQKLVDEKASCLSDMRRVKEYLSSKLHSCFEGIEEHHLTNLSAMLIQHCLQPRLMFSPQDALYSIHFLKMLHI
jgi:hypothetical protein